MQQTQVHATSPARLEKADVRVWPGQAFRLFNLVDGGKRDSAWAVRGRG